jgi:hypothetical protein
MQKQQIKKIKKCCKSCEHLDQIQSNSNITHRCKSTQELINNINNNANCNFYKQKELNNNEQ